MNIRFLGAVKGVTGSCHLIEAKNKKILLDCGQFQGKDEELNSQSFDFKPGEIDYLFLSHSHIDHCGRIPLLVKKGFKGTIYCSKPTYDLCKIMLLDSAYIHESEAEWKNRKAKRSGKHQVKPLYTRSDAEDSFKYFKTALYEQLIDIDESISLRFNDAGHILGSSIIEMWFKDEVGETTKLVFSGDLGMNEKPLLRDPEIIEKADYVIMEATYGNRVHDQVNERIEKLIEIILKTVKRNGTIVIPSFAVGRTQEIIYELNKYYDSKMLKKKGINELKKIPVYIDSPLATKATQIFKMNSQVFDDEARKILMTGDNPLEFENLHFTQSAEESVSLNSSDEPKIIISASGMCEAGRIKHHLKHNLWRPECSIVFVGYQAEGTLGRRIRDGEKDVKIFSEDIHINAEIYNIEGFSGHADKIGLMDWLQGFKEKPKKIFIVHGEIDAKNDFANEVMEKLGFDVIVPEYDKVYHIETNMMVVEPAFISETETEVEGRGDSKIGPIIFERAKQPAKEDHINDLLNEIKELKKLCSSAFKVTEAHLKKTDVNIEILNKINNNMIEIENEILNLTMLSGK